MTLTLLSILSYLVVLVSGAGFTPQRIPIPFVIRCFIGVSLCSLIVIPILYIDAKSINVLIPGLVIAGLSKLLIQNYRTIFKFELKRINVVKISRGLLILGTIYLFVTLAFLDFFPTNYVFNEHDLVYWSWATNLHAIDYSGTMKSEIAWPMIFTSNHLLPGMFLGYLNYLSPVQNLFGIMLLKFILITVSISLILQSLVNSRRLKLARSAPAFLLLFIVFRHEISYNFTISNYLATLITVIILWTMFESRIVNRNLVIAILFFILSFSKFILLPIGLVIFLFFYIRSPLRPKIFFSATLVLISISNICIWLFMEKPKDSTAISAYNPFNPDFFIQLVHYVDWVDDPLLNPSGTSGFRYLLAGFIMAVVIAKVFLLFSFLYKKMFSNFLTEEKKIGDEFFYATSWLIFMTFAIFGYVFLRVDSYGIKHSAHYLYLASTVTFIFACLYVSKLDFSKAQIGVLLISALLFGLFSPYKINDGFSLVSPMRNLSAGSVVISSVEKTPIIQPAKNQTHPQKQLVASIEGKRMRCSDDMSDRVSSPIYRFLYHKKGSSC
jgi:hypothetical protein